MSNKTTPTDQQIADWKKEHGEIYVLKVKDKTAYLHKPNRRTLSLVMQRMAKGDLIGASEGMLDNCWLGGDEEIKTDDELFMGAANMVGDLIPIVESSLEKL